MTFLRMFLTQSLKRDTPNTAAYIIALGKPVLSKIDEFSDKFPDGL